MTLSTEDREKLVERLRDKRFDGAWQMRQSAANELEALTAQLVEQEEKIEALHDMASEIQNGM